MQRDRRPTKAREQQYRKDSAHHLHTLTLIRSPPAAKRNPAHHRERRARARAVPKRTMAAGEALPDSAAELLAPKTSDHRRHLSKPEVAGIKPDFMIHSDRGESLSPSNILPKKTRPSSKGLSLSCWDRTFFGNNVRAASIATEGSQFFPHPPSWECDDKEVPKGSKYL